MPARHALDPNLDARLLSYAATSWNAYEATLALQQLVCLAPVFCRNLVAVDGAEGLDPGRRTWGIAADLVSAMTDVAPTAEGLASLGITEALAVGRVLPVIGPFRLTGAPVLRRLDFRAAVLGDLSTLLRAAVDHDRVAKPLLELFQDELRAFDFDAASAQTDGEAMKTFTDLVRDLPDLPLDFPEWDDRPMFLEEQQGFLEFLGRRAGAEIVADRLVDAPLGEFLLRSAGIVRRSEITGDSLFELNLVPRSLLERPIDLVCHQVGNAVLEALGACDDTLEVLDALYVVESAVRDRLDLDVTAALASTRTLTMDRHLRRLVSDVIRVEHPGSARASRARRFEFPDLSGD